MASWYSRSLQGVSSRTEAMSLLTLRLEQFGALTSPASDLWKLATLLIDNVYVLGLPIDICVVDILGKYSPLRDSFRPAIGG